MKLGSGLLLFILMLLWATPFSGRPGSGKRPEKGTLKFIFDTPGRASQPVGPQQVQRGARTQGGNLGTVSQAPLSAPAGEGSSGARRTAYVVGAGMLAALGLAGVLVYLARKKALQEEEEEW